MIFMNPMELSSPILIKERNVGLVEVFYLENCPPSDEGPFLVEERKCSTRSLKRLGRTTERISISDLVIEASKLGIFQQDISKHSVSLDKTAQFHFGLNNDELDSKKLVEQIHPEDRDRFIQASRSALENKEKTTITGQFRTIQPDGTFKWIPSAQKITFLEITGSHSCLWYRHHPGYQRVSWQNWS
jgi:PAS domain S-box-containing protein